MASRTIENDAAAAACAAPRELTRDRVLSIHGFYTTRVLHRRQFVITSIDEDVLGPKPFRSHAVIGHELWTLNEMDRHTFQKWTIETMDEYLSSSTIYAMTSKKVNRQDQIGTNDFT